MNELLELGDIPRCSAAGFAAALLPVLLKHKMMSVLRPARRV